jgi:hypothetical protein
MAYDNNHRSYLPNNARDPHPFAPSRPAHALRLHLYISVHVYISVLLKHVLQSHTMGSRWVGLKSLCMIHTCVYICLRDTSWRCICLCRISPCSLNVCMCCVRLRRTHLVTVLCTPPPRHVHLCNTSLCYVFAP